MVGDKPRIYRPPCIVEKYTLSTLSYFPFRDTGSTGLHNPEPKVQITCDLH